MKTIIKTSTTKNIILGILSTTTLFTSCESKSSDLEGQLSPYIAIEDVRALHKGQDVVLDDKSLSSAEKIYGIVVSDHRSGNTPEGTIVIQQWKRNRLRGITLNAGSIASDFLPGDSLVVNINNKTLSRNGFLTINGIEAADIEKVSSQNTIRQTTTTANNINVTPQNFEGTIVRIIGGQMYPKPIADETFQGTKLMLNGADTIAISTLTTAEFSQMIVPRNITVTGLVLANKENKNTIYPRYTSDILDVSDPEVPEYIGSTPIIITGFCTDPNGSDANYEYIQLKANVDINFSEVPFSVVTGTNAGTAAPNPGAAPGAGWATGGGRTFKFNLTEGSVKKGEYFYIGGHQKRINGPNSTSISQAKWIRSFQYSTIAGDGFGNPSSGLLPNSGNAGGIAVFIGTNISETTMPIDVVFFGGNGTATIISPDKTMGYRITNTDHYSTYIAETGVLTPFFSMGDNNNDFRFSHYTPADVGAFYKLGGIFNTTTRKWTEKRKEKIEVMAKDSPIGLIENGDGVTKQID